MAFEAMNIAVVYEFRDNARAAFGAMTAAAERANAVLRDYAESVGVVNTEIRRLISTQRQLGVSLETTAASAVRSFERTGLSAGTAARDVNMAFGRITASGDLAAEAIAVSTADMRTQIGSLGAAAGATAARVQASYAAMGDARRTYNAGSSIGGRSFGANATMGAGIAAAATMGIGLYQAAALQDAQAQVAIATGQSRDAVARQFTPLALQMSNATGILSLSDAMGVVQTLSTFIKNNRALSDPAFLNEVARYVDIEALGKHPVAPSESAAEAGRVAHMLGAYTAPEIKPVLDRMYRVGYSTPDKMAKIVTQMAYFAEGYRRAGVSRNEIMNMAILGGVSLGHGKWGNAYDTLLKNLTRPTKTQAGVQEQLGVRDASGHLTRAVLDASGNIAPVRFFEQVNRATSSMGGTAAMSVLGGAFNQSAKRIVELGSSDKNLKFYHSVVASQGRMESLQAAQADLLFTLNHETTRLVTNFKSLANILAGPLVKPLTSFMEKAGTAVGNTASWFYKHPAATAATSAALTSFGAWGGYQALKYGLGIGHLFAHAGKISLGLSHEIGGSGRRAWFGFGRRAAQRSATEAEDVATGASRATRVASGTHFIPESWGARIGRFLLDTVSFKHSRGVLSDIGRWGPIRGAAAGFGESSFGQGAMRMIEVVGRGLLTVVRPLGFVASRVGFFGGVLARLGLRAIPVVGEVLLLIDTIKLLGANGKLIGKIIGEVAHWIVKHGAPMLLQAFVDVVKFIALGVRDTIVGIFNGGHGGFWDWMRTVISNTAESYAAADKREHAPGGHHGAAHHIGGHGMHTHAVPLAAGHGGVTVNGGFHAHVKQVSDLTPDAIAALLRNAHRKVDRGSIPKSTPSSPSLRTGTTIAGMQFGHA